MEIQVCWDCGSSSLNNLKYAGNICCDHCYGHNFRKIKDNNPAYLAFQSIVKKNPNCDCGFIWEDALKFVWHLEMEHLENTLIF